MGQQVCAEEQGCSVVRVINVSECCDSSPGNEGVRLEHQLLASIVNGDEDKATLLLNTGPSRIVNCRLQVPMTDGTYMCYSDGATPLHLASLLGQRRLVQRLMEKKAAVEAADSRGLTAAEYAGKGHHSDIQKLLTLPPIYSAENGLVDQASALCSADTRPNQGVIQI
mmetsp:Transcript_109934/g.200117  ORF Transcript_109934/g.200117 Transcript_109934/m.200117 type:complete len:168 (-) Transcript_109934:103-606(-)